MAFRFNWGPFDPTLLAEARREMTAALNKGDRHPAIADDIIVHELHLGTTPPELSILEICEIGADHFRGIFELAYAGDAHIVLHTKAQANPIHPTKPRSAITRHGILAANKRLVVPMEVRISAFRLNGVCVLDVGLKTGVSLSFKSDPLKSVKVNTTFDDQANVKRQLQNMIEEQLRILVNHDLPRMVHLISLGKEVNDTTKKQDPTEWHPDTTPFVTPSSSPPRSRATSFSLQSVLSTMSGTEDPENEVAELLNPSRNTITAHLATLSNSAATMYPYSTSSADTGVAHRFTSSRGSSLGSSPFLGSEFDEHDVAAPPAQQPHGAIAPDASPPMLGVPPRAPATPPKPSSTDPSAAAHAAASALLYSPAHRTSVSDTIGDVIASAVSGLPPPTSASLPGSPLHMPKSSAAAALPRSASSDPLTDLDFHSSPLTHETRAPSIVESEYAALLVLQQQVQQQQQRLLQLQQLQHQQQLANQEQLLGHRQQLLLPVSQPRQPQPAASQPRSRASSHSSKTSAAAPPPPPPQPVRPTPRHLHVSAEQQLQHQQAYSNTSAFTPLRQVPASFVSRSSTSSSASTPQPPSLSNSASRVPRSVADWHVDTAPAAAEVTMVGGLSYSTTRRLSFAHEAGPIAASSSSAGRASATTSHRRSTSTASLPDLAVMAGAPANGALRSRRSSGAMSRDEAAAASATKHKVALHDAMLISRAILSRHDPAVAQPASRPSSTTPSRSSLLSFF
ncbi:hypothetical protein CAOG_04936 [Capsaspora owczarzaki ATCC 30864]|uniref:SMP-LTD domain-containing protein n=1 Tax=Capsaspora owczarzaki (strain ATCC 30864) TaxID=595528 RepID=A0A0D2VSW7_CAPO3|nr:hypothetical protein CAOG_04936 [Capsaspora owczarzaki ATCC 30864]KJE94267.1 hypothetical protein CAOG_004936 [Capsaspora owczarzaki ATCC 30864]|eukprot:XP_004347687.1 hypothetical protein CAOG_04936 [Capsaspora owczarzaki ATCC 30864]